MIVKKLAGIFAMIAVGTFLVSWLVARYWRPEKPVMDPEQALLSVFYVMTAYFILGLFLSTLGLGLLQEVLAERRSRELERRFQARVEYERVLTGGAPPTPPAEGEKKQTAAGS